MSSPLAPNDIGQVMHGTRANDLMEGIAMHGLVGGAVACTSTKGWTGHCMRPAALSGR